MKVLLDIFKSVDLLQQAFDESVEMLETDLKMFVASRNSLRKSETGEIKIDIRAEDAKINQYERDVRRKVLVHMTTTESKDIVFGLILVSIVIDIERIGDYTKNIMDLAISHTAKLAAGEFEEKVTILENNISKRFRDLIEAFKESSIEKARNVMRNHKEQTDGCEAITKELIVKNHTSLPCCDAVTLALYLRFLKRVSSHLTNIASGIVNPFDRIGFME